MTGPKTKASTDIAGGGLALVWPSRKDMGQKVQTLAEGHGLAPFGEWVIGLVSGNCPSHLTSSSWLRAGYTLKEDVTLSLMVFLIPLSFSILFLVGLALRHP